MQYEGEVPVLGLYTTADITQEALDRVFSRSKCFFLRCGEQDITERLDELGLEELSQPNLYMFDGLGYEGDVCIGNKLTIGEHAYVPVGKGPWDEFEAVFTKEMLRKAVMDDNKPELQAAAGTRSSDDNCGVAVILSEDIASVSPELLVEIINKKHDIIIIPGSVAMAREKGVFEPAGIKKAKMLDPSATIFRHAEDDRIPLLWMKTFNGGNRVFVLACVIGKKGLAEGKLTEKFLSAFDKGELPEAGFSVY